MPSPLTVFSRLKDLNKYLRQHNQSHWSARFEELVCEAFASLLHLPIFNADCDDSTVQSRVIWLGSAHSLSKAPPGPDGIAHAHGFSIVIEATRKTGTRQWSQEFGQCLRHAHAVANETKMDPADIYTVLLATKIHEDTYQSVKARNVKNNFKIVLMEVEDLCVANETSLLAFTIRHFETRNLFNDLLECLANSGNLGEFRDRTRRFVEDWQKRVLKLEKPVVLAVRSYRVMMKERSDHVAVSQILRSLTKAPIVKWYFGRLEGELGPQDIVESLVQESLGAIIGRLPTGEHLFCPVPLDEFRSRCKRRLHAVERAYAKG